MQVDFYPIGEICESELIFAVIPTTYQGQWLFVQHKDRTTWEIPGGRKEQNEPILETAKRELCEETGALTFELLEICDYSVTREGTTRFGRLFYACAIELGPLPDLEIARVVPFDDLPQELTYPDIQPLLLQRVEELLCEKDGIMVVSEKNLEAWVELGLELWPDNERNELLAEFTGILRSGNSQTFLYRLGKEFVGFVQMSIRTDYVEGSSSSPVGYVEGIYVREPYRKRRIANRLLQKGEEWARAQGCSQMGSDMVFGNELSYNFHLGVGFKEAGRIVCFIKDLS